MEETKTPANSPRSPISTEDITTYRMDTLQREQIRNQYICCGENIDNRILTYAAQLIISMVVLIFCIIKLLSDTDQHPLYISILSSILGYYLGNVERNNIRR